MKTIVTGSVLHIQHGWATKLLSPCHCSWHQKPWYSLWAVAPGKVSPEICHA